MSLASIWFYCARALQFAGIVAVLWVIFFEIRRRIRKEAFSAWKFWVGLLAVSYLAMLVQIIVIRDWQTFFSFLSRPHTLDDVILVPLETTILEAKRMGLWWEIYHASGNVVWFAPFGFLCALRSEKMRRWGSVIAASAGFSLFLEVAQWVFATGVSDVDDILLNTLGGCLGLAAWKLWMHLREKK